MIAAQSFIDHYNPLAIFVSSAVVVWLFVWGGIRMWHTHQARVLRDSIQPLIQDVKNEQERQATIIAEIHHEVNLNSGSSIKDAVLSIRSTQVATNTTLVEMANKIEKIDKGLERHLGMHDGVEQEKKGRRVTGSV